MEENIRFIFPVISEGIIYQPKKNIEKVCCGKYYIDILEREENSLCGIFSHKLLVN